MMRPLSQAAFVGLMALSFAASPAAGEYEGLGVTRASIETMLRAEGLNPKQNTYPDFEGEKVTELNVFNPFNSFNSMDPMTG